MDSEWEEPPLARDYLTDLPPRNTFNLYVSSDGTPRFDNRYEWRFKNQVVDEKPAKKKKKKKASEDEAAEGEAAEKPEDEGKDDYDHGPSRARSDEGLDEDDEASIDPYEDLNLLRPGYFLRHLDVEWLYKIPFVYLIFTFESNVRATGPGEEEDDFHIRPSIRLPVPDHIKAILVDDWENVTKNNQLVPLPHPHPAEKVINDYLEAERPNRDPDTAHLDILEETMAGLKDYFDKSLGRILLYRFERPQYHEMRKAWEKAGEGEPKTVCETYGAEHICRLIVSLPELVAQTTMDSQSVNRLREELASFTAWLGKNAKTYFVSEYETPSQQYIDGARNF